MSNEIRNLEPNIIWNNFSKLNAVPRPSKKEEKVIKFIHDFGVSLGLETQIDKVGNVVIFKPLLTEWKTERQSFYNLI